MPLLTQGRVTEMNVLNNVSHTAELIPPQLSTRSMLPQATQVPGYATVTHSPLTMGSQHRPPYGVPAYIRVSTYPPHVPLAVHMYHPSMVTQRVYNNFLSQ